MADITQDSFDEALKFTKVIFQRGRDCRDSEMNEFQDILRVMLYRHMYNASQKIASDLTFFNPGSNDDGYKITGTGASNQVSVGTGYLFCDGIPVEQSTSPMTLIGFTTNPGPGARTDVVYLGVTEVEVADPSEVPELGETTRRRQLQATLGISTTGLAGVPSSTVAEIWEGGVHYFPIASINRPAGQAAINAPDVTDLRKFLLPSFVKFLSDYATDIDNALQAFVDLITTSTGTGAIGSALITDSFPGPGVSSLAAGTLANQLKTLLEKANNETRRRVVSGADTVFVIDSNIILDVATGGAAFSLQLLAPSSMPGQRVHFWSKDATIATQPVTLVRAGAEKIKGLASNYTLDTPFGHWVLFSDGTDWYID